MQRNARNLFIVAVAGASTLLFMHACSHGFDSCVETRTCPPRAGSGFAGAATGGVPSGLGMGGVHTGVAGTGATDAAGTGGATVMPGAGGAAAGGTGSSVGNPGGGGMDGIQQAGSGGLGATEAPCDQRNVGPAQYPTACLPIARGVPGMQGPPQWSGVDQWATIDDPRWSGAARQSFPNFGSMSNDAAFRGLSVGNTLYLSLQAQVDPDGATTDAGPTVIDWDSAFVGFRNPTTGQVSILEVDAKGLNQGDPHTILAARHWTKANDAAVPSAGAGGAPWASDLKLWESAAAGATTIPWAVNLKVDLAAVQSELGTSSPTQAQFWYGFTIGHACCSPFTTIVSFHWPPTAVPFDLETSPPTFPTTGWAALKLGVTDPSCAGVRICGSDIGTTNTPSTEIRNDANNTFRVTPNWGNQRPVSDLVEARFRIASWSSQTGAIGNWVDMPGASAVPNLASGVLEFTCNQGGPAPACLNYVAPADYCILAELSPKGASGISFAQDSAYRCMSIRQN